MCGVGFRGTATTTQSQNLKILLVETSVDTSENGPPKGFKNRRLETVPMVIWKSSTRPFWVIAAQMERARKRGGRRSQGPFPFPSPTPFGQYDRQAREEKKKRLQRSGVRVASLDGGLRWSWLRSSLPRALSLLTPED